MVTAEKGCILATFPTSKKDNQWQPKKLTVEPEPSPEPKSVPKPRTWLKDMKIKQKTAIKYRDAHIEEAH